MVLLLVWVTSSFPGLSSMELLWPSLMMVLLPMLLWKIRQKSNQLIHNKRNCIYKTAFYEIWHFKYSYTKGPHTIVNDISIQRRVFVNNDLHPKLSPPHSWPIFQSGIKQSATVVYTWCVLHYMSKESCHLFSKQVKIESLHKFLTFYDTSTILFKPYCI